MAYLLCIETSTEVCSVAVANNRQLLVLEETGKGNSHAEQLMPFIDSALTKAKISSRNLDALCISEGPGSFTGLRIGASTVKGLCYALNKPLIAVSTLQSMAWGSRKLYPDKTRFCPMIDARRMEVYCAVYDNDLQIVENIQNKIIDIYSFAEIIEKQAMVFSGNGTKKCKEILPVHPNFIYSDTKASAAFMIDLAFQKFENKEFQDIAYFEPFYLKEFIPGKPHVKGL